MMGNEDVVGKIFTVGRTGAYATDAGTGEVVFLAEGAQLEIYEITGENYRGRQRNGRECEVILARTAMHQGIADGRLVRVKSWSVNTDPRAEGESIRAKITQLKVDMDRFLLLLNKACWSDARCEGVCQQIRLLRGLPQGDTLNPLAEMQACKLIGEIGVQLVVEVPDPQVSLRADGGITLRWALGDLVVEMDIQGDLYLAASYRHGEIEYWESGPWMASVDQDVYQPTSLWMEKRVGKYIKKLNENVHTCANGG